MTTTSLILLLVFAIVGSAAFMVPVTQHGRVARCNDGVVLASSFFDDFEDFEMDSKDDNKSKKDDKKKSNKDDEDEEDDDEEDEDDDEEDEYADVDVAAFRSKMGSLFGEDDSTQSSTQSTPMPQGVSDVDAVDELISFARKQGGETETTTNWAKPATTLEPGVVLIANPEKFCSDFGSGSPSTSLLAKFGLTVPPPADLGPDRRADLLPVLMIVEQDILRGSRAVLLNRRTGYLLGDLEAAGDDDPSTAAPMLEKFCIQPLWFGGVDNVSGGLSMLHQCPTVEGAKEITEDGLFWGGDPNQAQDVMEDTTNALGRPLSGFDFKFFVQATMWNPLMLQREVDNGNWYAAKVDKEILFKSRDRMGSRRATPLWTEILNLMGGEFKDVCDEFYKK